MNTSAGVLKAIDSIQTSGKTVISRERCRDQHPGERARLVPADECGRRRASVIVEAPAARQQEEEAR